MNKLRVMYLAIFGVMTLFACWIVSAEIADARPSPETNQSDLFDQCNPVIEFTFRCFNLIMEQNETIIEQNEDIISKLNWSNCTTQYKQSKSYGGAYEPMEVYNGWKGEMEERTKLVGASYLHELEELCGEKP